MEFAELACSYRGTGAALEDVLPNSNSSQAYDSLLTPIPVSSEKIIAVTEQLAPPVIYGIITGVMLFKGVDVI